MDGYEQINPTIQRILMAGNSHTVIRDRAATSQCGLLRLDVLI
jgi:hypothetical protein